MRHIIQTVLSGTDEPELTAIIEELNHTVDQNKRAELAEAAVDYVDENMINSFILHPDTLVAYDSKKVKNWITSRSVSTIMITNKLNLN